MTPTLIHYSTAPLTAVHSVEQTADGRNDKPTGLWFSVGDDEDGWRAWCEDNMAEWIKDRIVTEVVLTPTAKMLRLTGAEQIDAFTAEYSVTPTWASGMGERGSLFERYAIDWRRVASEYQGIIIAPYVWSRRIDDAARWYYGWDCASGCLWDAAAVASLKQRTAELAE